MIGGLKRISGSGGGEKKVATCLLNIKKNGSEMEAAAEISSVSMSVSRDTGESKGKRELVWSG